MPRQRFPRRVKLQQLLRQILHRPADARLRPGPLLASQTRQRRGPVPRPHVPAHAVDLIRRDEKPVALGVTQLEILALDAVDGPADEAREASDTVIDVDDEIARLERRQEGLDGHAALTRPRTALLREAEDLRIREQFEDGLAFEADAPAVGQRPLQQGHRPGLWRRRQRFRPHHRHLELPKDGPETRRLGRDDERAPALAGGFGEGVRERAQAAAEHVRRAEREADRPILFGRPAGEREPQGMRLD